MQKNGCMLLHSNSFVAVSVMYQLENFIKSTVNIVNSKQQLGTKKDRNSELVLT